MRSRANVHAAWVLSLFATGCAAAPAASPAASAPARQATGGQGQAALAAPMAAPSVAPAPDRAKDRAAPGLDDALAALDRAEQRVRASLGARDEIATATLDARQKKANAADESEARPPAPAGAAPAPPSKGARAEATPTPVAEARGCTAACPALASMRRAADTVCRIVGEGDDRCAAARARVAESAARTAPCGCAQAP